MNMKIILTLLMVFLSLPGNSVMAKPLAPDKVPEPLKSWVDWVLQYHPERDCAFYYQQFEQKQCSWPIDLVLDLTATGGHFQGHWQVDQESWLFLPGDADFWPQQVLVNRTAVSVVNKDERPAVKLSPGKYVIEGDFIWDYIPEQLRIAEDTGLIKLNINHNAIAAPTIKEGVLWLKDSERGGKNPEQIQDRLDIQVFRQIIDEVPLQILTHIELDVAGSAREVKLSQALLQGFIPMRLDSALPARIEPDGQLLTQLRPGRWQVELLARYPAPVDKLTLQETANWPKEEVWVFDARPNLRLIEILDLDALDASQTNLPEAWRNLPAYRMNGGQTMTFKIQRRGNPEPEPNQLNLSRQLWLDFDGHGYTIKDQIKGQMTSGWRLNALPETQLGKVSLDGQNQLITRTASNEAGVEVRQGAVNVEADSRYSGNIRQLTVSGWQHNFHNVSAEINLPPGWHLLAASGVDNVPDSWVSRWTLLDLFMVLIAALAIAKLYPTEHKLKFSWGLFALVTLALCWHESDAPHWVWLHILAATALLRVLPEGRLFSVLNSYRKVCGLALVLVVIPFIVAQVRIGLYPQLEMPWLDFDSPMGNVQPAAAPPAPVSGGAVSEEVMDGVVGMPAKIAEAMAPQTLERKRYDISGKRKAEQYTGIDPHANVQTGPGLPQWQWRTFHLSWNGSVDSQQQVKLWYLSPKMNMLLNFLRVVLVSILALRLFGQFKSGFKIGMGTYSRFPVLLMLPFLMLASERVNAEFPDQGMLDQLEKRLLEAPDCLPACAEIAQLQVEITPEQLQLKLQVDAEETVVIPLPAEQLQWLPEQVVLDGVERPGLLRSGDGQLWLQVTKGRHQLLLKGPVPVLDKFTLAFSLKPHHVSLTQTGWETTGVHEHGQVDQQLQFTRVAPARQSAAQPLATATLPSLFRIERTLHFGLDWRVNSRAIRLTPVDSAAILKVPLLPGEAVLSPGMRVDNQQLLLNIEAQQTELSWDSVLAKAPQIQLIAPSTTQWTELWRVDVSPIWHLESEGLAPVHPGPQVAWQPEWQPWPGERVTLKLTRPEGIAGQTLTLESSHLRVMPGKRITEVNLRLQLKSSKGGQHTLTLPEVADLQSVMIDGALQPIRQQAGKLTLPVKPGAQDWLITWRQAQLLETQFKTPTVNLGLPSVNSHIKVVLGQDRWVLFTMGPRLGPAVLFLGILLVIGLLAVALAKTRLTPLHSWQWFLLLVGISQIPLEYAMLVVAWFMLLAWRAGQAPVSAVYFNALQVFLAGLTIVVGGCLFVAVERGLLGTPEMQIMGNLSSAFDLNWYQDRSAEQLPVATIISVPLLGYRCLMLFWSLWLAVSLIAWLKWGWQCFISAGLWRSLPVKQPPKAEKPVPEK